ncbi:hypothetical protein Tco_0747523 [Tanacetum coccineum]|uniref:Copia protein n=1 Tax=Tanacetum coccineum TaxID=301880 RepID=A0ABQ4YVS9_9ASTR
MDVAISTTEAEYVSARKACQQALWLKQALIDYDTRLDDVPVICDNKGAIDLSEIMSQILQAELRQTLRYIPKLSNESSTPRDLIDTFRNLESRGIREGRVVHPSYSKQYHIKIMFNAIKFHHVYNIDEPIFPIFL